MMFGTQKSIFGEAIVYWDSDPLFGGYPYLEVIIWRLSLFRGYYLAVILI